MKILPVLPAVIGLPVFAFLALQVIVPGYYKLTAVPVHAGAGSVPVHAAAATDARFVAAAEAASRSARALASSSNLAGLSVAVGVDGRLVWAAGFGWADIAAQQPVTPDTQFRIGAVSMPLTAAGVGLLVERGQLDLDAPVQEYVPDFPRHDVPISTRQAMAHTAGFRHFRGERDYLPQQHCESVSQSLDLFAGDDLEFAPGTAWDFSSYGWMLVSAVVESAAGTRFDRYMAQEVFAPLGMRDTVPDDATRPIPQRTQFYWPRAWKDTSYGLEHPQEVDYSCFGGAAGYLSTPSDLVRFGLAMNAHALLDARTTELLQAPVALPSGKSTGYGLGWFVDRVEFAGADTLRVGHPGMAVGGMTSLQRFPEHGIVVAVSSNVTYPEVAPFAAEVARLFSAARA